jgi:hypothetical protein
MFGHETVTENGAESMRIGGACANGRRDDGFAAAMVECASILIVDGGAESRSLSMQRLERLDGLMSLRP